MKRNIIVLMTLFLSGMYHTALGQQDALFTQYIDAQLYSNAATAGSNDRMVIAGIHRQQWAGFQGAPMTSGLMIHTPLHYESIGVGLEVWNDRIGTLNRTTVGGNFAYRLKFKKGKGKIAFGVKALVDFNFADISQLSNGANDLRAQQLVNSITPNAGLGILYKSPRLFIGAGMPRVLPNKNIETNGGYVNNMHAYVLAGVLFDVGNNWIFRPTTQVRGALNTPLSIDVTATFISNEKLYFGINYRLAASIGFIMQYQLNPRFKLGYAFDLGTSALLRTTNYGSHEVVISYDMNFTKASVTSPRFF